MDKTVKHTEQLGKQLENINKTLGDGLGGKTSLTKNYITTTVTAYSSGDTVGSIIELPITTKNKTVYLQYVGIFDDQDQKSSLYILFFDGKPVGATTTDNSAFAWGTSFSNFIGKYSISSSDYVSIASKASVEYKNIGQIMKSLDQQNLYAVIVSAGTPSYTASSTTLRVDIGFLVD